MTRAERDRPAALAASEASQAKAKRDTALRDAAPELLAALKDALELIETVVPFEGDTARKARAAIRKATGDTE